MKQALTKYDPLTQRVLTKVILSALSGVLFALPFLNPALFPLTWIAFVPLLLTLKESRLFESYILGLIFGLVSNFLATYWIKDFIHNSSEYSTTSSLILACVYWIYCAQLAALMSLFFVWLRRWSRLSDYLLFPPLVVVFYSFFPQIFPIQPGASQSHFLLAIQAIEYTGVYGLDFMIVLVNILIYRSVVNAGLTGNDRLTETCVCLCIFTWFVFGFFSVRYWDHRINQWESLSIGLIQPNEKPSIDIPRQRENYSYAYPLEMEITKKLAARGAELVVWPELRFKGYHAHEHTAESFHHHVSTLETPLILQDIQRTKVGTLKQDYNTSVLITPNNEKADIYRKRKLIPIGETSPFLNHNPVVDKITQHIFGGFHGDLQAGSESKVFSLGTASITPLICYEVIFPIFVANSTPDNPQGMILLAQSNNSWFGNSHQPYQHLYSSILRSVENRLPLIHSTNNGPSGIVTPDGRLIFESSYGDIGGHVVNMPFSSSSGGSFFNKYPTIFVNFVQLILTAAIMMAIYNRYRLRV